MDWPDNVSYTSGPQTISSFATSTNPSSFLIRPERLPAQDGLLVVLYSGGPILVSPLTLKRDCIVALAGTKNFPDGYSVTCCAFYSEEKKVHLPCRALVIDSIQLPLSSPLPSAAPSFKPPLFSPLSSFPCPKGYHNQ